MNNWLRKSSQLFAVVLVLVMQFVSIQAVFTQTALAQSDANRSITDGPLDTTKKPIDQLPKYEGGVEQSIRDYLCTPSGQGTDLYDCIGRLYRAGIAFGAIALVFFIVYAGYLYISGGETAKGKAKGVLFSAFSGMGLLLVSFVLLRFINPALVEIRPIQAPIFRAANLPSCEEIGFSTRCVITTGPNAGQVYAGDGKAYGGRGCTPITNDNSPASINNLKKTCWGKYGDEVVRQASIVAANETGGRPIDVFADSCGTSKQARCSGGEVPVYGVFQINLAAHKVPDGNGNLLDCPSAFSKGSLYFCSRGCTVTNKDLYNRCYQAVKNLKNEMDTACKIYEERGNTFAAWGNTPNEHGKKCGF